MIGQNQNGQRVDSAEPEGDTSQTMLHILVGSELNLPAKRAPNMLALTACRLKLSDSLGNRFGSKQYTRGVGVTV